MLRSLTAGTALALALSATAYAAEGANGKETASEEHGIAMKYPETRRENIVEDHFGEKVADPYRWLENDVRNDPEVAAWVAAENEVTGAYLDQLPGVEWFKAKMGALLNYERYGIPFRKGNRYFYSYNSGLMNQSQLFVREGLEGKGRLLIDPNTWSKDAATALSDYSVSDSGRYLGYQIQDGGTDWRIIKVMDVDTGKVLDDEIHWAKFTEVAWIGDEGFLYSRFPEPEEGQAFQQVDYNKTVYFHRIGTPQSDDTLVFATPDSPTHSHAASVTDDGHWAVITTSIGTDSRFEVRTIDLTRRADRGWKVEQLIKGFDNRWSLVDTIGDWAWFVTDKDAPRSRIVKARLGHGKPEWTTVVGETEEPISGASIVGDRLIVEYLKDAASLARLFTLDGKPAGDIALNGIGTAGGFTGRAGDPETFYAFTSFNRPSTIYRLDLASGATSIFAAPELTFKPDDYSVEQVFYASKDGTKVPMFIVKRKDVTGPAPTLLYGYGGFDISETPGFSSSRMAWMEAGGVFALANIRGGGEYGKEWHDGGRLKNKQNVFDDFIAAGEYLKANGYTSPKGLAIQGGSNGGLLVGAVTNQRPDLVDAANAQVGVMDMLRFTNWTAGRYWVDDYGDPSVEADWKVLRAYSPYHNIRDGVDYPPVLVSTADTDDRVVPGHSFKYAAALQHADVGHAPHLIRIETRAGHGSGKPTDKVIEEYGEILGFLAHHTGLQTPAK